MITGTHILFNSAHPEEDRAFFRNVLKFHTVDVGHGWLIFGMPPAEAAVHPIEPGNDRKQARGERKLLGAVVYFMCDDLKATIAELKAKKVACSEIHEENWGISTTMILPSGSEISLYQPKHQTAIGR